MAPEEDSEESDLGSAIVFGESVSLVSQGAEARVFALELFGMAAVAKHRFEKHYRAKALDARLRKERTVTEVRCIARCRQLGIAAPMLLMVDSLRYAIYMERVPGLTAKAYVDRYREKDAAVESLMKMIGGTVARIHSAGMTHGDLTTSNFLCRRCLDDARDASYVEELVVIDFGLGGTRALPEDKAVDLYVLERALVSTHLDAQNLLDTALEEYFRLCETAPQVKQRLEAVRARGRKRECFG